MSTTFNRQMEEHVYRRTMDIQQQIQDKHDGTLTPGRQQEQSREIALEKAAHRIRELETLLHAQTLSNVAPLSELNDVQNADKWVSAFHLYPREVAEISALFKRTQTQEARNASPNITRPSRPVADIVSYDGRNGGPSYVKPYPTATGSRSRPSAQRSVHSSAASSFPTLEDVDK